MNRISESLICAIVAGLLYLILRNYLKTGTAYWGALFSINREETPVLFRIGLISQCAMIAIAIGSSVWFLLHS